MKNSKKKWLTKTQKTEEEIQLGKIRYQKRRQEEEEVSRELKAGYYSLPMEEWHDGE